MRLRWLLTESYDIYEDNHPEHNNKVQFNKD